MTQNLRQQQKEKTRGDILMAAKELFLDAGYESSTTRQIADAAGVGIGTVFAHFPDKHALLQELLLHDIDEVLAKARRQLKPTAGWLAAAMHYARHLYAYHHGQRNLSISLLKEVIFDTAYYQEQVGAFNAELAARMATSFPNVPEVERRVLGEITVANYFMVLIQGLGTPDSTPKQWLAQLELRCRQLLRPYAGA
jgi:AcrR family transcriptional regulator